MRVTILLFGRLHDLVGASQIDRDLPAGATVGDAWATLARDVPSLTPYERSVSAAVNADFSKMGTPLAEGDEVAFLPPVSGGSRET